MFHALQEAFFQEIQQIKASWYKLFLLTLFPLISFFLIGAIFYKGVAYNMPVAVVDNDKTQLSRDVLFAIESTPTIAITHHELNSAAALKLLHSSTVYGVIVIPKDFSKNIYLHHQPQVTAFLNTQYILIGKILKAALLESVNGSAAALYHLKSPIELEVTPFFNTQKNYFYFLVGALIPSIWQIFIVIATIVSFGSMFKAKQEKEFFNTPYIFSKIIGKMLPYTLTYFVWGVIFLFTFFFLLQWPFHGAWSLMLSAVFVTTVAYQGVALLFLVTGFDYARALSLGAVYTAPAFAFLGITFPVYSMNDFALFWREMLPLSYYMEIQIAQANYGANPWDSIELFRSLFMFWSVFVIVWFRIKQRVKQ